MNETIMKDTICSTPCNPKPSITEISTETGNRLIEVADRLRLLLGRISGEATPNYDCKPAEGLLQSELKNSDISCAIIRLIGDLEELI